PRTLYALVFFVSRTLLSTLFPTRRSSDLIGCTCDDRGQQRSRARESDGSEQKGARQQPRLLDADAQEYYHREYGDDIHHEHQQHIEEKLPRVDHARTRVQLQQQNGPALLFTYEGTSKPDRGGK